MWSTILKDSNNSICACGPHYNKTFELSTKGVVP